MHEQIHGDPSRQATESLRGYAYQLYTSALAWMTLPQDGMLFLEVAEDYATLVAQRLNAVQVKATTAALTLNSKPVHDTIDSLFELRKRNPDQMVAVEYLTTATIGRESAAQDRVAGEAGLLYWQKAAEGANVAPLRERLLRLPLKQDAKSFLERSSDEQLRSDLLDKISWRCGEPPFADLKRRLRDLAIYRCDEKDEPIHFAQAFEAQVILRLLEAIVTGSRSALTKAGLIQLFDSIAKTSVPTSVLNRLLEGELTGGGTQMVTKPDVLETLASSPFNLVKREHLVGTISDSLTKNGVAWLHAGTGYGKSTLAAMAAERVGGPWKMARFSGLGASSAAAKLSRVATEIAASSGCNVVVDDLEPVVASEVQSALCSLIKAARRRNSHIVFTSHYIPSPMRLREWSVDGNSLITVPDFTEQEVNELVEVEGGSAQLFGRYIYMGSTAGHPQLAHALLIGLRERGWPSEDLLTLPAIAGTDTDIEAVRQEVRLRLLSELPTDELQLLARLTLIVGPFSREFALSLAEKPPAISLPGKAFDRLLGPWIDVVSQDKYRSSSLVMRIGKDLLGPEAATSLNADIARLRLSGNAIDANQADGILLNALIGGADDVLNAIFAATFSAQRTDLPRLAQSLSTLLVLRTDQPILPKIPKVSARLRVIQVMLLAAAQDERKLPEAQRALDRELGALPDREYASLLYLGVLSKLSIQDGIFDILPGLVARLAALRHDPVFAKQVRKAFAEAPENMPNTADGVARTLFAFQIATVKKMSTLFRMLDEFAALPDGDRQFFIGEFKESPGDKALAVRGPYRDENSMGDNGAAKLISDYVGLAAKALDIGDTEVAAAGYETAAIICDEDLKDPARALDMLANAIDNVPQHRWSLQRHRARILLRVSRYEEQLAIAEELISTTIREDVEMAYFLRETAIGYAHLKRHVQSADWFERAAGIASKIEMPELKMMAIGLHADAAVQAYHADQGNRAVQILADVLPQLEEIEDAGGFRQKALHAYIPHSVAYILNRLLPESGPQFEYVMVPGMNSNPNPHPGISELTRAPIDFVWLLLAQLEALLGDGSSVRDLLRSSAWDNRIPTLADHILHEELLKLSISKGNAELFWEIIPAVVAGRVWASSTAGPLNPFNSPRGRIPEISRHELQQRRAFVGSLALIFLAHQVLSKRSNVIPEFLEYHEKSAIPALLPSDIEAFHAGRVSSSDNTECSVIGLLHRVATASVRPSADDLFMVGIRLIELGPRDPTGMLLRKAYDWALAEWEIVVEEQRFRLRDPNGAVEVIKRQKSRPRSDAGLAELTLEMRGHVAVRLSDEIMGMLRRTC